MVKDLVMVLNIWDWMWVSGCVDSTCCESLIAVARIPLVAALVEVVDGVGPVASGCSFCETNLRTSSFKTRPSLPVPVMSRMLRLCVLSMPRTAGVAREACFDCGFSFCSDMASTGALIA